MLPPENLPFHHNEKIRHYPHPTPLKLFQQTRLIPPRIDDPDASVGLKLGDQVLKLRRDRRVRMLIENRPVKIRRNQHDIPVHFGTLPMP